MKSYKIAFKGAAELIRLRSPVLAHEANMLGIFFINILLWEALPNVGETSAHNRQEAYKVLVPIFMEGLILITFPISGPDGIFPVLRPQEISYWKEIQRQ